MVQSMEQDTEENRKKKQKKTFLHVIHRKQCHCSGDRGWSRYSSVQENFHLPTTGCLLVLVVSPKPYGKRGS